MSMAKVGVGVIGAGSFGELHIEAYKSLAEVEVVAASDLNRTRLDEIARKYSIPHTYPDANDLCARPDIDLVSIATPEAAHVDPVLAAARGKKHILLEKPIATTLEDAAKIIDAAAKAHLHLMVGHILRFESHYATVKREVQDGNLGKIVSIHARRNRPKKLYSTYSRTHGILENSIHDIDVCRWYTQDRVKNVRAFTRNIQGGTTPDINWSFLEFAGGAVACIENHWLIPDRAGIMTNDAMQIIGSKAVADIHLLPSSLNLWREEGAESANVTYDAHFGGRVSGAIKEEIGYFVECVRKNEPPSVLTPQDAFEALRVALALIRSSEEQRDVALA
jgi:UDP-N-acetylglucosamine 3-dehydrogenase